MIFRKGTLDDLNNIMDIKEDALVKYKESGLNWDESYPNIDVFRDDIQRGHMYVLDDEGIVAIVVLNDEEDINYKNIKWIDSDKTLVIHRLLVNPRYARRGIGKKLLNEVEEFAKSENIFSIKLDTNSNNRAAQGLYKSMGYSFLGEISLKDKIGIFYAMQKIIKTDVKSVDKVNKR